MGQRTNIILIAEDKNGMKKVEVYHDQWGIGRKMPLAFMAFFTKFYNSAPDFYGKKSFLQTHCEIPCGVLRISHEYTFLYDSDGIIIKGIKRYYNNAPMLDEDMPSWIDFKTSSSIGKNVIDKYCDNNNGAMVIFAREEENGEWNNNYFMKIGFLLGHEDEFRAYNEEFYNKENKKFGVAYKRWLTPNEYLGMPINNDFSDKMFVRTFNSFLRYFEIETFGKKETITGKCVD